VGFITKLTIGGVDFTADQTCKNPLKPTEDLEVVGVASDVLWELGVTDAVYLTAQLSVLNRQSVMGLLIDSMPHIETVFKFMVFEYDPVAKAYFKCFDGASADLKGLLEKKGEDLNLAVSEQPSTEVQSPENYTMNIGVKPQPSAQTMTVASSSQQNVVKAWGLAVG
jgi:hypothetical protein